MEMEQESVLRHTGQVKFFNSTKGYGFILPDNVVKDGEENIEEVFVHHTAIHNSGGFKSLAEGEKVEYDLVQGPKGMQASNVTGPEGSSVQGDPRTHRQPYQSGGHHYGYRNGNNRGQYNAYMMEPYNSIQQQGYPSHFMYHPPPPQFSYYPQQQQQQQQNISNGSNSTSPQYRYGQPIYYNYDPVTATQHLPDEPDQ